MATEFPSSWNDPRYIAAILGVILVGVLVFFAELTEGPPAPGVIAGLVVIIGIAGTVAQFLYDRAQ